MTIEQIDIPSETAIEMLARRLHGDRVPVHLAGDGTQRCLEIQSNNINDIQKSDLLFATDLIDETGIVSEYTHTKLDIDADVIVR